MGELRPEAPAGRAAASAIGQGRTPQGEASLRAASDSQGLAHPVLAVPATNPARCFAVSLYGPHASGTDLYHSERSMLARIAHDAAAIYAELESKELRKKVTLLEDELKAARAAAGFQA